MVFYTGDTPLSYGARTASHSGSSTTYRYTEIKHPVSRSSKCPICGKRVTRSTTFTATQNPFNKDPETGQPKTYEQIRADLRAKVEAWAPDFTHGACEVSL